MRWGGSERMYHPYFRGKQYELISVREMAAVLAGANFRPIIEPVRETLNGLHRSLDAVVAADGRAIVIVNPHHGDLSGGADELSELLKENFLDLPGISAGILLKQDMSPDDVLGVYETHVGHSPVFVHAGFTEPKVLTDRLGGSPEEHCHIFLDKYSGPLYRRHFKGSHRVLVKDGFQRKKNREYDLIEPFSDLHATFNEQGMDGFGDFLIVGDEYSESGGPAYAIAIHLTFIDPDQDNTMLIYHFVSDRQDTPKDPAGKFAEALAKMMKVLNRPGCKVLETEAVKEFRALHRDGHFPGLGYVKKLSMNHHIETLANYLQKTA